jgi:dethiobiotin synthase
MTRLLFVTGTDTGVGKTVLTSLLLAHGLARGMSILAMKPFCSGGRRDVEILDSIQAGRLPAGLLNPFYFDEPVAPLVSQRLHHRRITLAETRRAVRAASRLCETLLIEGSGGLLVPLGEGFTVLDLILSLDAEIVLVSRNKLGTVNHTLLAAHALKTGGILGFTTVLMNSGGGDSSTRSNPGLLSELLAPDPLVSIPALRGGLDSAQAMRNHAARLAPLLERILVQG